MGKWYHLESTNEFSDDSDHNSDSDYDYEEGFAGCKMAAIEDNIYLVGTERGCLIRYEVEKFHPPSKTWRDMPCVQEERSGHSVCALGKKIFVAGGEGTKTCEVLDTNEKKPQWRYIASMNNYHFHDALVECGGKIYMIGEESVEMYDVDKG